MSLETRFQNFLSSLEITDTQSAFISEKHKTIRERIETNAKFGIENTLLYGSYQRSSQIRPLPQDEWTLDVDILVIIGAKEKNRYLNCWLGNNTLLEDLKESLGNFQGLDIEIDSPSISIKWRNPKIKVEVTPAIRKQGGGFYIPQKSLIFDSWIESDPLSDADALSKGNQICGGQLKPFIKALKCWNRHNGNILQSFAIETLAFHSATTSKFRSYDFELKRFFKKLLDLNEKSISSPSGQVDSVKIQFNDESKIKKTITSIDDAYELEKNGNTLLAINKMRTIFGNGF